MTRVGSQRHSKKKKKNSAVESTAEVIWRLLRDVRITVSYGMTEGKSCTLFSLSMPTVGVTC